LWKTHFGADVSASPTTGGFLDKTPFQVDSGSFQISNDTIDGKSVRVIECVSDGSIHIPTCYFHQTNSESAYGCWEWHWRKGSPGAVTVINFISDSIGYLVGNNYNVIYRSNEVIDLTRGTIVRINGGTFPEENWVKTEVCRSVANEFELTINGTSQGTATDANYTISKFMNFDMDAADKVAYSDITGGYSFVKSA
jgi:hypothetical protein